MTHDERGDAAACGTVQSVNVTSTNSTSFDTNKHFALRRYRFREFSVNELIVSLQYECFHFSVSVIVQHDWINPCERIESGNGSYFMSMLEE